VNITVYRLVQECLTNVAKHARARRVTVSLQRSGEDLVRVSVCDDGCGVDLAARRTGLGLVGLRERVEALQGRLRIDSHPGGGFQLEAFVPAGAGGGTAARDEVLQIPQDVADGAAHAAEPLARPAGRVHAKPQP
jgi:signal transduction histidine kinase